MSKLFPFWLRLRWNIKEHPLRVLLFTIPAFLDWAFPIGAATIFAALAPGKSVQQWLAENGFPTLTTLIIGWGIVTLLVMLVVFLLVVIPSNSALRVIEPYVEKLNSEQKSVLRSYVSLGRAPSRLPSNEAQALEFIYQTTPFVTRHPTGHYEINEQTKNALELLLRCDEVGKKQWFETPENELVLSGLEQDDLAVESDKSLIRPIPGLEISYAERSPFVSDTTGPSGIQYKTRTVAITAPVRGKVSLKIPMLSIGKANYPNIYLRSVPDQPEELEAGETGYWHVLQTNTNEKVLRLMRKGNEKYNFGTECQFEIEGRCSDLVKRKLVTAKIEGNDLQFHLDDV
jgi:hypothetical protein